MKGNKECPKCGDNNIIQNFETLVEWFCDNCKYEDEEDVFNKNGN